MSLAEINPDVLLQEIDPVFFMISFLELHLQGLISVCFWVVGFESTLYL